MRCRDDGARSGSCRAACAATFAFAGERGTIRCALRDDRFLVGDLALSDGRIFALVARLGFCLARDAGFVANGQCAHRGFVVFERPLGLERLVFGDQALARFASFAG